MPIPMTAEQVLDRYFLEMRCKVLDVAAALDRIERAAGGAAVLQDPRVDRLKKATQVLFDARPDRAQRVLMIFSDEYEPAWPRP